MDPRFQAPALSLAASCTLTQRLLAVGFQNGRVLFTCTPLQPTAETPRLYRTDLDGPITALSLIGKPLVTKPSQATIQLPSQVAEPPIEELDEEVLPLFGNY